MSDQPVLEDWNFQVLMLVQSLPTLEWSHCCGVAMSGY